MPLIPIEPFPDAPVDSIVDVLFGVEVADPYRWLEDGESPATTEWTEAQNRRTRAALDAVPERAALHTRFTELLQAGTTTAPRVAGERLFALEREAPHDQSRLVLRSAVDPTVAARAVVEPGALTGDPTAALDWFHPSPDGRLLAFGLSLAGSEHSTLYVLDVDAGERLPDVIPDTRAASVAWLRDGSAFAYTRYPPDSEYGRKVYWHELGTDPAEDELLFGADLDDETAWTDVDISLDGRWLVVHVERGWTRTDAYLIERATGAITPVVEGVDARTSVQVLDDRILAVTTLDAPRGRVIEALVDAPQQWTTVVPEGEAVIDAAIPAGDELLVLTTDRAVSRLHRHPSGQEIPFPELGSVAGIDADHERPVAFVSFTSFTRPPSLWRWTPDEGLVPWTSFASAIAAERYVVEQISYASNDGTEIPMFLVRAATTAPTPDTPCILTAYGGFAIASSPAFGPGAVTWCDAGGLYAVACIRGGGEFGEDWHRAGMLDRKQQVFDDFAAAGDWLVATGRTSRARLAIRGGSNGGLLVGATITQRPDLCRAAVCAVPLLDMVRYPKFLIGALWIPEYGNPEREADFGWLHGYSPYHHVVDGTDYPATLILTAESDTRVDPLHARKMAARLQAASPRSLTLLRVESRAGHGVGKPVGKQADELADTWAFLFWQLGLSDAGAG